MNPQTYSIEAEQSFLGALMCDGADAMSRVECEVTPAHFYRQDHGRIYAAARKLVEGADCLRCHGWERTYVGPSFVNIAVEYHARSDASQYLAGKIRGGSVGVWGNVIMPRHPQISDEQSLQMASWILAATPSASSSASSTASPAEEAK